MHGLRVPAALLSSVFASAEAEEGKGGMTEDVFHFEFCNGGMICWQPNCDTRGRDAKATVRVGESFYCRDCYCELRGLEPVNRTTSPRVPSTEAWARLLSQLGWLFLGLVLCGCAWLGLESGIALEHWLSAGGLS